MAVSRLPASAYGPLGRVHVRVSRIGFGGYRVDDRSDVHREALREALVSRITLVDTSSNYADGHSEILVGEVVRDVLSRGATRREDLVLVTKAGYVQGTNQREAISRAHAGRPLPLPRLLRRIAEHPCCAVDSEGTLPGFRG